MQVHLRALGCRLNEAELESWARDFRQRGFGVTNQAGGADVVVVNTCAVTEEAVRKSRKLLRRIHRDNPDAKIVLSGCYPSLNNNCSDDLPGIDLVVGNDRKDQLPEIVVNQLDLRAAPLAATEPGENLLFARGRQRAFIKVQDGCRYRCTYCVVTLARGDERSRPIDQVVGEINRLADEGIKEVVLAGVHLGGYGSDIGSDLRALIAAVLKDTQVPRVRLGSLEPWDIPAGFWPLFDNPRLMPHLHLPIQSGADSVLRRMARRCKSKEFRRLVAEARKHVPDINLTTDIILGFPGETEDEFNETLDLVEEIGFGHVHIFSFSPRSGTKAALLADQVPDAVKRQRSRQLHELAARRSTDAMKPVFGRTLPVLVETVGAGPTGSIAWGYTPGYQRVAFEAPAPEDALENTIVEVTITGHHPDGHLSGSKAIPSTERPISAARSAHE